MKLATQNKPFFPDDFAEKLSFIQSLGFKAFEIDGKELVERFREVKQAVTMTGVPVCTACGGYRGWIGDFDEEKRQQAVCDIGEMLKHLAEIGGKGIVVPAAWGMFSKRLPPLVPPRTDEEDRHVLLNSLQKLDEIAKEAGTYVYLEPLNRYEDHMINKIEDAVRLIREGAFSHVQVAADLFHMNIEEANIQESLRTYKDYIGHVHIADSNRYQPGSGHLDFAAAFQTLREIGFEGYMAFECRVLGEPEEEVYRHSVTYIQSCFETHVP